MRPALTIAALIAASPAFAARCPHGELYRVHLHECVSLTSPLARPYVGNRANGQPIHGANVGKEIDAPPPVDRPDAADSPVADRPPDVVDKAAWRMIPLLQAAEARWAAMVFPRIGAPPPNPWPSLSIDLGNFLRPLR